MALKSCLCCNLRTGSLTIAYLGLFGSILMIILYVVLFTVLKEKNEYDLYENFSPITISFILVDLVISAMLIFGVVKKAPNYFLPWIYLNAFGLIFAIPQGLLGCLFISPFYLWYVVYSLHKKMEAEQTNQNLNGLQMTPNGNTENFGNDATQTSLSLYPNQN